MSKRQPKVLFFRDDSPKRQWRWTLVASNGRRLCTPGESFSSKTKAQQNFDTVVGILRDGRTGWILEYKP